MDGENKKEMSKDPYVGAVQQASDSIRPDFTEDALGKKSAVSNLRNAESSALKNGSTKELDANTGETDVRSGFVSNVGKGEESNGGDKHKKNKAKGGFFKKKGPILSIVVSLIMGGGGMFLGQSALPFTMLDKLNGLFDTTNTSTELRSAGFMKRMVKNNTTTSVTKRNIFGKEKFKPTGRIKRKLGKQGITFSDGMMIHKDKNGATSKMGVAEFKNRLETDTDFREAYTKGTKSWRTSVAEFKDKIFSNLLKKFGLSKNKFANYDAEDDPDGNKARAAMAQDADNSTDINTNSKEESKLDFVEDPNSAEFDPNSGEQTSGKSSGNVTEGASSSSNLKSNVNTKEIHDKLKSALGGVAGLTSIGCGFKKAISAMSVVLSAYQLMQVITVAQDIFEGIDKARTEDANSSPINAIGKSLTMQVSEERTEVEKNADGTLFNMNIGKGSSSADDPTYTTMTTKAKSAVQSEGLASLYTGDNIDTSDESVMGMNPTHALRNAVTDTINSAGNTINSIFQGNSAISTIVSFAASAASTRIDNLTTFANESYVQCMKIEAALAIVSGLVDAAFYLSLAVGLFTGGASAAAGSMAKAAWEVIKQFLKSLLKAIVINIAITVGTSLLINLFKRQIATTFAGEDLGNALYSGGSALMSKNHMAGGGVVASKEGYLASLIYTDKIQTETGINERLARSPFDYTSGYTFAGQLASAIIPITMQSDSILDSVGNFGSVVRNSINTIIPGASAASAAEKAEVAQARTEEECPELAEIGAVADAFCNPYVTTDFQTLDDAASEAYLESDSYDYASDDKSAYSVMQKVTTFDNDNFYEGSDIDDVDNPSINLDSNLGKYILYCGQRNSPFGQPDQNVAAEMDKITHAIDDLATQGLNNAAGAAMQATGVDENDNAVAVVQGVASGLGSTLGTALGMVPVVGDLMTIISNGTTLANYGWVDGSNCVMDHQEETNPLNGVRLNYDEIQTYNRYVEDQRLAESMGVIEESSVTKALNEYYEKNPLDTSLDGTVARMAGITKDNLYALADTLDFYKWLAYYDPTDAYPTPAIHEEDSDYRIEDERLIKYDGVMAVLDWGFRELIAQRNFATA